MIHNIKPVTNIFSISVYRKFLSLKCIVDDQRNQFFRELIWSVVIAAVCDVCREFVSIHIGFYQHIRRCLTCRIWAVRIIWSCLIEEAAIFLKGTIHFICRNMQEFLVRFKSSVRKFPCRFCCIQHNQCTKYICFYKYFRVTDTSVHMTLCCKMNNAVDIIFIKDFHDCFTVTDISFYKCIVFTILDVLKILKISRICQFIYINDTNLIVIFLKHVMNIVGSDKSGSTCYKVCSHIFFSS